MKVSFSEFELWCTIWNKHRDINNKYHFCKLIEISLVRKKTKTWFSDHTVYTLVWSDWKIFKHEQWLCDDWMPYLYCKQ